MGTSANACRAAHRSVCHCCSCSSARSNADDGDCWITRGHMILVIPPLHVYSLRYAVRNSTIFVDGFCIGTFPRWAESMAGLHIQHIQHTLCIGSGRTTDESRSSYLRCEIATCQ